MPKSVAEKPAVPEELMALVEVAEGVVGHAIRPPMPPATAEEDEVEGIERNKPRPQAVRILRKHGDEVVVVKEEDTTRELRRLESALAGVMKLIKVSTASRMLLFDVGDQSSSS